jgi:C4-dicarboxylate-specific signal transduction histidine kinase
MKDDEVAFSGRITAAFTHEVKNVLAIIKEASGLMEDLLSLSRDASFPHRERLARAISTIQAQVNRGVELSTRLNRFAHSLDEPVAAVDLKDMIDQFTLLAQRFARLKEVSLTSGPAAFEGALNLVISPVRLQMALMAAVEACWGEMPAGAEVSLRAEKIDDEAAVCITCLGDLGAREDFVCKVSGSPKWAVLEDVMANLEGKVEWERGGFGFFLIIPGAR